MVISTQVDEDVPLTRALLLPKKKIAFGKWPLVYGVLNSLLLAAAIILAKPYFYEGETIVSAYSNEYGYGGGYHQDPGYGYSDEYRGKHNKGKGYSKGKGHKVYPVPRPIRSKYSKEAYPPQAYAVIPAKGKGHHRSKGYDGDRYESKGHHSKGQYSKDTLPQAYAVIPGGKGGSYSKGGGLPQAYAIVPSKGYGKSHPSAAYALIPADGNDGQYSSHHESRAPHQSQFYSSHTTLVRPQQSHNIPTAFEHRSDEFGGRDRSDQQDLHDDAPFNELHYYNPTVMFLYHRCNHVN